MKVLAIYVKSAKGYRKVIFENSRVLTRPEQQQQQQK
jgi:hypothetical protein